MRFTSRCILGYSEMKVMCILAQKALHRPSLNHVWPSVNTLLLKQGAWVGRTTPGWGLSQKSWAKCKVGLFDIDLWFPMLSKCSEGGKNWASDESKISDISTVYHLFITNKIKWKTSLPSFFYHQIATGVLATLHQNQLQPKFQKHNFGQSVSATGIIKKRKIQQVFINFMCTDIVRFCFYFLHWDLSVDKNSLSISPADKILAEHIQTIDGQRLAGQHVSGLQAALAGVSTEPGTDERLVSSSWGHGAVWDHAVVSAPWKATTALHFFIFCHTFCHVTEGSTNLGQPELKCLLTAEGKPCKAENMWLHTDRYWDLWDDMTSLPSF